MKASAAAAIATPLDALAYAADGAPTVTTSTTAINATAANVTVANAAAVKGVTRTLARYVVNARYEDLPAAVRKEGTPPQIGLEGKFSVFHSVAVAIIDGAAGEKQYSDASVRKPNVIALRDRINASVDLDIKSEQVDMTITLKDGTTLKRFIKHAIGSVEVPMTDLQLEAKFTDLADGILSKEKTRQLMDACWMVEQLPAAAAIASMAVLSR